MRKKTKTGPDLARCPRCKRVHVRHQWNVCDRCLPAEEADHSRIREELSREPELSAEALAERAQVNIACVLRMLGEGLLATSDLADQSCGKCGAQAISAKQRLCARCLLELDRRLGEQLNAALKHRVRVAAIRGTAQGLLALLKRKRRVST